MLKFIKKHWPLLGLFILFALIAFYLVNSDRKSITDTLLENILPEEGVVLKDIQFAQENPDKGISWTLNAGEMRSSTDKKYISFHNFLLKVKYKNRPPLELKGDKGNYSRESHEINLLGNLDGVSEDGYRIITDKIKINENSGQINTDSHVKIFGPFFSIEGQGLLIDHKKETLKILSNVTTKINMEPLTK